LGLDLFIGDGLKRIALQVASRQRQLLVYGRAVSAVCVCVVWPSAAVGYGPTWKLVTFFFELFYTLTG